MPYGTTRETYELENLEQFKAIAHPLRGSILGTLAQKNEPRTVADIARELNQEHGKINYHMQILVEVGLVELVEKREHRGILSKYYQSVARSFITEELWEDLPDDFKQSIQFRILRNTFSEISSAIESGYGFSTRSSFITEGIQLHLSDSEVNELLEMIKDFILQVRDRFKNAEVESGTEARATYSLLPWLYQIEEKLENNEDVTS